MTETDVISLYTGLGTQNQLTGTDIGYSSITDDALEPSGDLLSFVKLVIDGNLKHATRTAGIQVLTVAVPWPSTALI